jgi:hypothetical protein
VNGKRVEELLRDQQHRSILDLSQERVPPDWDASRRFPTPLSFLVHVDLTLQRLLLLTP